ncbi:MAG: DUF4241 domain-containing protein [Rhizobiaceae bacterium]
MTQLCSKLLPWPVLAFVKIVMLGATFAHAADVEQGAPQSDTLKAFGFLQADEAKLTSEKIKRILLGEIDLASGRIVGVDPLTLYGGQHAFTIKVAPGNYPVHIYAQDTGSGGIRVALAELRLDEALPVTWKIAASDGQDVASLKDGEIFGYAVDAGLGSFMSPETLAALEADMKKSEATIPDYSDYYTNVLAKDLEKPTPNAMIFPIPSSPANKVAIFHSGWGDGFYPSYFGYDAKGTPVTLVTTFFVLEDES